MRFPTVDGKRLGDGFYEQRLINEQVAGLTGRRFLANYTSDEAEPRPRQRARHEASLGSMSLAYGGGSAMATMAGNATANLLNNLNGNAALPKNQSEKSRTLSVISPATITITGSGNAAQDAQSRQTATELTSRDPKTANASLKNTLTLQQASVLERDIVRQKENQAAAQLVGAVLSNVVGDVAASMRKPVLDAEMRQSLDAKRARGEVLNPTEQRELARLEQDGVTTEKAAQTLADPAAMATYENWKEGSPAKMALHGIVGLIEAKIGNGSAAAGALGGMAQEAMVPLLSDYLLAQGISGEDYKSLMQLGATLAGTAVGALAGGAKGAAGGATAAFVGVTNNFLSHPENEARRKAAHACSAGDSEACKERDRLDNIDIQRDNELRTACYGDGKSSNCSLKYAEMLVAMSTYAGKSDLNLAADISANLANYSATGELESFKKLLNVPHYDAVAIGKATLALSVLGNLALDMTPVVGDAKAFAEANTKFDYLLATIGALGPVGDAAKVLVKEAKLLYEAGDVVKAAEKLSDAKTVLGHHPEYMVMADELGARRFSIPMAVWNKLSEAERWAANQKFLDRLMARGDEIVLATPLSSVRPGSYFARELEYLSAKGYRPNADGTRLIKVNE